MGRDTCFDSSIKSLLSAHCVPSNAFRHCGGNKEVEDAVPAFEEGTILSFSESRSLLFSEVEKRRSQSRGKSLLLGRGGTGVRRPLFFYRAWGFVYSGGGTCVVVRGYIDNDLGK